MDRMRALEVFVEVAEHGSFAAAARNLRLSAPTVTRVVAQLEEELGVSLFHRTTRALHITDSGRSFLPSARRIVHDYRDASDALRGAQMAPKGILRITASTLFGRHYVSPILVEFVRRFPDVDVEAVFVDRVVNVVEEGFDLAVRIGALADSNLIATRVGEVRRVVCGCPEYLARVGAPTKPAELADRDIIAARPISPTDRWHFGDGSSVHVKPRLAYSSVPAAIAAVTSKWGITRVLSYQIGPELGASRLQVILADFEPPPLPIHLVHPEGRARSAKVRAFVEMAAPMLRAHQHLQRRAAAFG